MAAPACRIQLCGSLAVRVAGRRVEAALPGRQGPLLLAHLVLHRGRAAGRDELVDALWPHVPPAAPDASLRVLVSRLRGALGDELVPRRGGVRIALPPSAWVDVRPPTRRSTAPSPPSPALPGAMAGRPPMWP